MDKMLSVGLDTHLKIHQVEIQSDRQNILWRGQITNDRKGFNGLIEKLGMIEKNNGDVIAGIFINPTGTYHIPIQRFLESNGYVVFYIDPRVTDSARKIENLGKEKSDSVDAHTLASMPWSYKKAMERKPHIRSTVSELTRLLESVKKNVTRITNMLSSDLAEVFPEFLGFFSDLTSTTSLGILEKYSVPANIANSGLENLFAVMRKCSRNHLKMNDAERLFNSSTNSVGITDDDGIYTFRIRENVKRLRSELNTIVEIEGRIERETEGNDDVARVDDIRGIGMINAATIISEIGPIDQFSSSLKLQAYGGKAPNITGSGGKSHAKGLSRVRNPHLANAIYESSVSLVNQRNEEFLMVFNREISKGKKQTQAYTVVGRRLLYHIFTILKNGKPYRKRLLTKERDGVTSTAS